MLLILLCVRHRVQQQMKIIWCSCAVQNPFQARCKGSSFLCVTLKTGKSVTASFLTVFFSFSFCSKGQKVLCKIERGSPCRAGGNYSAFRANRGGSKWQKAEQHDITKTKKEIERNASKLATKIHFKQSLKGLKKDSSLFLGSICWYGYSWQIASTILEFCFPSFHNWLIHLYCIHCLFSVSLPTFSPERIMGNIFPTFSSYNNLFCCLRCMWECYFC